MAKGKGVLLNKKKLLSFHNILCWIKIYTDLQHMLFYLVLFTTY